jgi:hypothetical protein
MQLAGEEIRDTIDTLPQLRARALPQLARILAGGYRYLSRVHGQGKLPRYDSICMYVHIIMQYDIMIVT